MISARSVDFVSGARVCFSVSITHKIRLGICHPGLEAGRGPVLARLYVARLERQGITRLRGFRLSALEGFNLLGLRLGHL